MTISYNPSKINEDKLKQQIANAGYDSESHRATDKKYNSLHGSCQAPSAQSCSGWNGPNATSSLMNSNGWITAQVGEPIDIYQATPTIGISCCNGPNSNCGASSIFNPPNASIVSYLCEVWGNPDYISETITIPSPGIYQVTVKCGKTAYRICVLSLEITP